MRRKTWVLTGVGVVVAAGVGGGWYVAASGDGVDAIDFCERTDDQVAVGYTYGSGDTVTTSYEQTGGDVTVSVRTKSAGGAHIAVAYADEATFPLRTPDSRILGADGRELDCTHVVPDELGRIGATELKALKDSEAERLDDGGADE